MATEVRGVFTEDLSEKIAKSRVLVVGAGGIGCEILKNLVLSGFNNIEIIDLDTIDVSNLNRQFLFHKEHVGKSKAEVAKESALKFNPNVKITAHHDSITSLDYGVSYFMKFNLVLGALDNKVARNHVNRLCLAANIPLIESGTAGYNGQVELIKKGMTQCYECTPKPAQKTFPGCTIRNTPSEPIHCIVWAKHLFNQLFGETNEDEEVSPDTADPEAAGDAGAEALSAESNEQGNVDRVNTRQWAQNSQYDPEKLFNKFFHDDIKYLLSMSNLWKTRTPPSPMKWGELSDAATSEVQNSSLLPDQRIWTLSECGKIFASSVKELKEQMTKLPKDDHLVWDKDDKHAMDFVAACANIRANIFNIARKSRFDIKSMAGNIIPAIATTNAITAGIAVMHAFKVLQDQLEKCKSVYMRSTLNPRNQIFVPDRNLNPPNPKCYVCAEKPGVVVQIDVNKMSVKQLRDDVLIKALNMVDPDVIVDGKGLILISSEKGETDCNNDKKLKDLQIVDGVILKVDDFFQNYELTVIITHKEAERDGPLFEIKSGDEAILQPKSEENGESSGSGLQAEKANGDGAKKPRLSEDDDDDLVLIDKPTEEPVATVSPGKKRKNDGGEGPSNIKRAKVSTPDDDDDLIILDD